MKLLVIEDELELRNNILQFFLHEKYLVEVARSFPEALENINLNRKEFDVFSFFILNQDKLIHKSALAEHVWGDNTDAADNFDFIYSQIKNLRKKLKDHQAQMEIQAIYGVGYKLTVQ